MPDRLCNTLQLISPAAVLHAFRRSPVVVESGLNRPITSHGARRVFRSDNIAVSVGRRSENTNKPPRTTIHKREGEYK